MKKRGFTLVELMIAAAVFSIFMIYMYKSFYDEQRFFIAAHRAIDLQYDGDNALEYLAGALRNNVNMDFKDESYKVVYTDSSRSKVLIDLTGTGESGEINFSAEGRSLIDAEGNTICTNIEEVMLIPDGTYSELITIRLKLSAGTQGRLVEYTAQTAVNLRK